MFIENGYEVRKNVISKEIPDLAYHYYKLKVENNEVGIDNYQVPGTITLYGDTLGDAILRWTLPLAQEVIGEELHPCYTFMRIYNKGDFLEPHCDRPSCEFSATLPIHFDKSWPIMMQKYDLEKYGDNFVKSIELDGKTFNSTDLTKLGLYDLIVITTDHSYLNYIRSSSLNWSIN